jgi:hypothetical protein
MGKIWHEIWILLMTRSNLLITHAHTRSYVTPVAKRSIWLSYGASHTLLDRWEPNLGSEARRGRYGTSARQSYWWWSVSMSFSCSSCSAQSSSSRSPPPSMPPCPVRYGSSCSWGRHARTLPRRARLRLCAQLHGPSWRRFYIHVMRSSAALHHSTTRVWTTPLPTLLFVCAPPLCDTMFTPRCLWSNEFGCCSTWKLLDCLQQFIHILF